MMRHYPDLGSASDRLKQISHAARPIRSTTQVTSMEFPEVNLNLKVTGACSKINVIECHDL